MRASIVAGVTTIRTGRRFDRRAVRVEQDVLKRSPKDLVPHVVFRRSKIERGWRHLRQRLLVSDARVEKRNRGCEALSGGWARVSQRPDVAQTIVLGVVIAESVAQNRHERYPVVVFIRLDTGESSVNSDQLSAARHLDTLQTEYLRGC